MKPVIFSLWLVTFVALSSVAFASDYLTSAYEISLKTMRYVTAYDACVRQHFIVDPGPSAEQKFQAAINRSRTEPDADLPPGVTSMQVAGVMQKALDTGHSAVAVTPLQVDQKKCDAVKSSWPDFAKQSGLE